MERPSPSLRRYAIRGALVTPTPHNTMIDLTGQRFTRLRVLARAPRDSHGNHRWRCACDCGALIETQGGPLLRGRTKSCGCLTTGQLIARNTTHSKSRTPEYRIWAAMLQRCKFPDQPRNHRYAGRGIAVCERWHDFANFCADMGPRPSRMHTLERRDGNGNYDPDNCSWELRVVQNNNTSRNVVVTYNGCRMTMAQAIRASGTKVSESSVSARLLKGWTIKQALETPPRQQPRPD